jgi:hypothetical protein
MTYKLLIWLLIIQTATSSFVQIAAFGFAGPPSVQVKRSLVKRYGSVAGRQFLIDNQYGDVKIKTWSKNEILIDVTIITSAKTQSEAARLSEKITISDNQTPDQISYRTVIQSLRDSISKDTSAGAIQIKTIYKVYMPPSQSIRIKNEFGDIELAGCSGHIIVDEAFGNFKADHISVDSLNLEQSNVLINSLAHGVISVKGFELVKIGSITGNVYCAFELGKTLDIGLSDGTYIFQLDSRGISDASIRFAANLSANISMVTTACNFTNRSKLTLQNDRANLLPLIDTLASHKKGSIALNPAVLGPIHYHTVGSESKATVQIKAVFGRLTFK